MKIDQLQYFVETAKRQHVGLAAKFLNISPSAISHSIAALEEEFGHVLFEKQGRQIKLTHHGKLLQDRAEFLLSEVEKIKQELSHHELELRGHYRIAATHGISSSFVTPAWLAIQNKHPALTGSLISMKSGEVLAKVDAGEVDLGICLSPHVGANIDQEVIYTGNLYICLVKGHEFFKNPKAMDLNHLPSIAPLSVQGIDSCESLPIYQKLGIVPKISNYFDNYDVGIQALLHSKAWALLPDFILEQHRDKIDAYIPKGWQADYRISAIWPKYRVRTSALDDLVADVTASFKKLIKN